VTQAGEDCRNVARFATLMAGLPPTTPAVTVNRLCASGLQAVTDAARAITAGEGELYIAGGVESMSRAPYVFAKSESPYGRDVKLYDTTIGSRFTNPKFRKLYGDHQMPETGDNVARDFDVTREQADEFALASQKKYAKAEAEGFYKGEIMAIALPSKKKDAPPAMVEADEHPRRDSTMESLAKLKPLFEGGVVTAGNASGVNDGSCAMIIASEAAAKKYGLTPRAHILGMASAGVAPRIMGFGPSPASKKLLARLGIPIAKMDVLELNEAFAAQVLAALRDLGVADDAPHVNPNGGAIALGHPLGASGARLVTTAMHQLRRTNGRYALCTMCIGVGQGIALAIERV
jgi:3-oxoadipyl-CoA thiolase